jgi:hypothetical protein
VKLMRFFVALFFMVDQSNDIELLKKRGFFSSRIILNLIHKKGSVWYHYVPNLPVFASKK